MKKVLSIIILLGFVLSSQYLIAQSEIISQLQEDNTKFDNTKVNSTTYFQGKVVNNLTADSLVLDTYNISQYSNFFHGFDFYNGLLYLIADHNSTARKVLIIELENFTLLETFFTSIDRDNIQVTEEVIYLSRNAETSWNYFGDILEISTTSKMFIDFYYYPGVNPIVLNNIVLYLDKVYTWRFRNGRWYVRTMVKNDPRYEIYDNVLLAGSNFYDLEYDNYRFAILTNTLVVFHSSEDLSFENSIILPGVIEETYDFTGMGFDGRYYWLLSQNTKELIKVDLLANLDFDKDGLSDSVELDLGTNLRSADTDEDGMDDYFEFIYGLNNTIDDTAEDKDDDGLTNLEEYNLNSNPTSNDSDNDGLLDKYELEIGTDLNNKDTDGDGLSDSEDPRPLTHIRWWEKI